jgi:undecaprenyl diphosphate synthase
MGSTPELAPELANVPYHIGIIMDGNGRWARSRGLPRLVGHQAGVDNIKKFWRITEYGVKILSLYAFSTENWNRPPDEVTGLMRLLGLTIERQLRDLHRNGVRILHSGRMDGINPHLQKQIRHALEVTKDNTRITVNLAFNYGGRAEIVDAFRRIIADQIPADQVTEGDQPMSLQQVARPRSDYSTAGEWRLSNFLIWQAAYAEYYATPTFWPDFDESELRKALVDYSKRQRKFGRVLQT